MYALVEETRARTHDLPGVTVVGYGHVGDSNLHLNISAPPGCDGRAASEILDRIEPFVYEWTSARGGSVSAEHGLGLMKAERIGYSKPPAAVALMGRIKRMMDPNGILNPYKVLPAAAVAGGGG
jgi:D-2-hydroxyglutarate dehydrogenase